MDRICLLSFSFSLKRNNLQSKKKFKKSNRQYLKTSRQFWARLIHPARQYWNSSKSMPDIFEFFRLFIHPWIKQLINLLVWIRKCASSELLNKQGKTGRKRVGCTSSRWSICSWIEMVHGYIYLLNLTQVVKEVGKRMMEKAYMGEPSRQSGSLSNEE